MAESDNRLHYYSTPHQQPSSGQHTKLSAAHHQVGGWNPATVTAVVGSSSSTSVTPAAAVNGAVISIGGGGKAAGQQNSAGNPFINWAARASTNSGTNGTVVLTTVKPASTAASATEQSHGGYRVQVASAAGGYQGIHQQQLKESKPNTDIQRQDMIENGGHVTPVPSPHVTQQAHGQPTNDTAFPGGLRHSYSVVQGQHTILTTIAQNEIKEPKQEYHLNGDPLEKNLKCPHCEKAFAREEHLKRHIRIHTDEPIHRCEVPGCNKAYTRKERLNKHLKFVHLGVQPERLFWCSLCGKDFNRKEHLQRHQKNVHGPNGKLPGSTIAPPNHLAGPIVHAPRRRKEGPVEVLHCSYEGCKSTYTRKEHLNKHLKKHQGILPERNHFCGTCSKSFTRKEHLQRHVRIHTGETPYNCPHCTKSFARREHMKRHERAHTGEGPPFPPENFEQPARKGRKPNPLKNMHPSQITIGSITTVKKEPGNQDNSVAEIQMAQHGVFGDQTPNLLNVIAKKGPVSPDQLGIRATQHVKAIASASGVKRTLNNVGKKNQQQAQQQQQHQQPQEVTSIMTTATQAVQAIPQTQIVQAQPGQATRSVDISFAPANVHPEMTKMPPGFSIFQVQEKAPQQIAVDQTGQVAVAAASTGYYQTQQATAAHVATAHTAHTIKPGELTTIPVTAWGWPVNIRSSPAKLEPAEGKHWENPATYFRTTFS